jgi:hypothetical protein
MLNSKVYPLHHRGKVRLQMIHHGFNKSEIKVRGQFGENYSTFMVGLSLLLLSAAYLFTGLTFLANAFAIYASCALAVGVALYFVGLLNCRKKVSEAV